MELLSEPKKKIQKLSSDLAVHSSEIDNTTASTNEAETNNMILEVFRQAKEIIEYYSNQNDATALQLYR